MKTVAPLTEAEHITLTAAYHDGPWPIFRQRAHAMLLSDKGYAREAIADLLSAHRTTVSLTPFRRSFSNNLISPSFFMPAPPGAAW